MGRRRALGSTVEQVREALAQPQSWLNRRLAQEIYPGGRERGWARDGRAELIAVGDPRAVEFVVEMRRYRERETLGSRL